ncbi:MAG: hypothetical protein ACRDMX_01890 [Solirubrobacteraceae bacterium]
MLSQKIQRGAGGGFGLLDSTEAREQLPAGGVKVGIALQVELIDDRQRPLGVAGLCNRDRVVELDDRRAGERHR